MESKEIEIDFEGRAYASSSNFERIVVPEDSYNAKITSIEQKEMQDVGKPAGEKSVKLLFRMLLQDENAKEANNKEIVHIVAPKILKAPPISASGKVYSNSKLYDLLIDTELLEIAKERKEELRSIDGLNLFLSQQFANKVVRVKVKTAKKNTPNQYSIVEKILRFVK